MKPVVHYRDGDESTIKVGCHALVVPVDDQDRGLNFRWVSTSVVQSVRPGINGTVFETLYSIYEPCEIDESLPDYAGDVAFTHYAL